MIYRVQQTAEFARWHSGLCNLSAKIAIARRIDRAAAGNFGDTKSLGGGLSEMRLDVGSGYRIYSKIRNRALIVLLAGGDKSTQSADINRTRTFSKRQDHE